MGMTFRKMLHVRTPARPAAMPHAHAGSGIRASPSQAVPQLGSLQSAAGTQLHSGAGCKDGRDSNAAVAGVLRGPGGGGILIETMTHHHSQCSHTMNAQSAQMLGQLFVNRTCISVLNAFTPSTLCLSPREAPGHVVMRWLIPLPSSKQAGHMTNHHAVFGVLITPQGHSQEVQMTPDLLELSQGSWVSITVTTGTMVLAVV